MIKTGKFCKPIKMSVESHKLLHEEAHKNRMDAQEVLDQLIKKHIGEGKYKPFNNIPKLVTKDLKLEGDLEAFFIFNENNFEKEEKEFLRFLQTIKKAEIRYSLLFNENVNIEMKLSRTTFYYYNDDRSPCNYEFNRKKFLGISNRINPERWKKIFDHFEGGPKNKEPYYRFGDDINKIENLFSEEDIKLIKKKMTDEGNIFEADLIKILKKYKDVDTSYISDNKYVVRKFTEEDISKEEVYYQGILPDEGILDNKHKSTRFDDIINSLSKYKITCNQNYWNICYSEKDFERDLKLTYGCTEEEIKLLKATLKKYPFDNTQELVLLQEIKELISGHNCTVKVKVEPFRQVWMRTGEQKILNPVVTKKEFLNFNYDDIRNSLILSDKD